MDRSLPPLAGRQIGRQEGFRHLEDCGSFSENLVAPTGFAPVYEFGHVFTRRFATLLNSWHENSDRIWTRSAVRMHPDKIAPGTKDSRVNYLALRIWRRWRCRPYRKQQFSVIDQAIDRIPTAQFAAFLQDDRHPVATLLHEETAADLT